MKWEELTIDKKLSFVIKHLYMEESLDDLRDAVNQHILFNDLIEDWYEPSDEVQGAEWKTFNDDKKAEIIWNEIKEEWEKEQLIEFLIGRMDSKEIEAFKIFYN